MAEILSFLFPIFRTSRNYGETLSKLAGFAFYEAFLIAVLLRQIPEVDRSFNAIERVLGVVQLPLLGPVVVAVCVALMTRALNLHNLISDAFGIRRRFDIAHILQPLAARVGFRPSEGQQRAIEAQRDSLMRLVFYKYASSRSDNPLVDRHELEHAIDAWAWFWWPVEATALLLFAAVAAVLFAAYGLVATFLVIAIAFVIISFAMYPRLKRHARIQVDAIAENATARMEVLARFNAL